MPHNYFVIQCLLTHILIWNVSDKQGRFYLRACSLSLRLREIGVPGAQWLMIVLIGVVFKWLLVDGGVYRIWDWRHFCGNMTEGNRTKQKMMISPLIIGKIMSEWVRRVDSTLVKVVWVICYLLSALFQYSCLNSLVSIYLELYVVGRIPEELL